MNKEKKYIDIDGYIYALKKFNKEKELKLGYAYKINKKIVLPYFDDEISNKPGIYKIDGEIVIKKPMSKKKAKKYSIDNTYTTNLSNITKILNNEGVRKDNSFDILGETEEEFTPNISDEDNALQQLIKKSLKEKKIDLKNYESRFDSPSDLNNNKRSLLHHGKMSYEKFTKWCDVLDLNFKIIVFDKDIDVPNPVGTEIEYQYFK